MSNPGKCPQCGAPMRSDAPDGACLRCAFESALAGYSEEQKRVDLAAFDLTSDRPKIRYFGDYEILEKIGQGGMGIIYKAVQISLDRIVAIKFVSAGGLASPELQARFLDETRHLASLQHPNIVAIHEVGEHEGQHYFSMDFVAGEDLAQMVRAQPLPPGRAARYVLNIARTIQYAHEKGILHRDLKPSNVLIDPNDQPRITDFGLAKSLHEAQFSIQGGLTLTGQRPGTPSFMPPEQIEPKLSPLGVHSDIYSLGALLYHLITGRPPFVGPTTEAIFNQVLTKDPPAPRLLNPEVPLDLETICLKCLEKEPVRRYHAALELAEELGRFERGETILARPAGAFEKTFRWCKRNSALAIAMLVAVLVLIAGIVASTWQAVRATRAEGKEIQLRQKAEFAERLARLEASKSQEVAEFLKQMLAGINPATARGRDTSLLKEILDRSSERIEKGLKQQPEVEADLRDVMGTAYEHIGEYPKAEAMHRRALELTRRTKGKPVNIAASLSNLGIVLDREGKFSEAEKVFREALEIHKKLFAEEHPKIVKDLANLGNVLWRQSKLAEAEQAQRSALAMAKKLPEHDDTQIASILGNLGILAASQHHPADAEKFFREALELQRSAFGDKDPRVAQTIANLGHSLAGQGKLAEAERFYREAVALRRELLPNGHPDLATSLNNLGELLAQRGNLDEAEAMHREALTIRQKRLGNEHAFTKLSLNNLVGVLERQGKLDEAAALRAGTNAPSAQAEPR